MTKRPAVIRPKRAICVYCGSAEGLDPAYMAAARTLGGQIAAAGFGLVYGGASIGLMGEAARAALEAGGHVLGVIPGFLKSREVHLKEVSELIVTQDMHERKMQMFERSDAFVALPGGIGTLEELFEQMTWSQLGRHGKPIIIADVAGFWQPLLTMLDHMEAQSFLRKPFVSDAATPLYEVVAEPGKIVPRIETLLAANPPQRGSGEIAGRF